MRRWGAWLGLVGISCGSSQGPGASNVDASVDATVEGGAGATDDAAGPDMDAADAPSMGAAFGPDAPAQTCTTADGGALGCPPPPAVCLDGRFAVVYVNGRCASGSCTFTKYDLDCETYVEGGTCIGGAWDGAVATADGGALLANTYGCLSSLGPAPMPPAIACDSDGGADAATCPLPRSVCAGSASKWLLYYDDGQCVSGQCTWQLQSRLCTYGCDQGACVSPIGTQPAPTTPQ